MVKQVGLIYRAEQVLLNSSGELRRETPRMVSRSRELVDTMGLIISGPNNGAPFRAQSPSQPPIESYFDVVESRRSPIESLDEVFRRMLYFLSVKAGDTPQRAIMVDSHPSGLAIAKKLGCVTVGVQVGEGVPQPADFLSRSNAIDLSRTVLEAVGSLRR